MDVYSAFFIEYEHYISFVFADFEATWVKDHIRFPLLRSQSLKKGENSLY